MKFWVNLLSLARCIRHLKDFKVSEEGKTIGTTYFHCIEELLKKPGLIDYPNKTLNKQESVYIIGDPESKIIVAFEKSVLSDEYHFISAYEIDDEPFKTFTETGNLGLHPVERRKLIDELHKNQTKAESLFHSHLPNDSKISYGQLRDVERLREAFSNNPDFRHNLTNKDKNLLLRAQKYEYYKEEYWKNTTKKFDEKL